MDPDGHAHPHADPDAHELMTASYFGERLIAIRHERNLTRQRFASMIGVTVDMLATWEHRDVSPRYKMLLQAARGLGVPVCTFFPDQHTADRSVHEGRHEIHEDCAGDKDNPILSQRLGDVDRVQVDSVLQDERKLPVEVLKVLSAAAVVPSDGCTLILDGVGVGREKFGDSRKV